MIWAADVQPTVTYGGAAPYTDYFVSGDWASAREWVGEMTIDPFIDIGTMYIRIKDAAAADDKWLTTGTDAARFTFKITKNGAQSMSLQGEGGLGENDLTWIQDDYDTLAGYNIYRATEYDSSADVSTQNFKKINKSVISGDECSYTDTDVEQGVDYYYYFTVVDTAFNESTSSNVVKCTPQDGEAPVITHTAVKSATEGGSISITAAVTDNVKVKSATLYYRMADGEWQSTAMKNTSGTSYKAVISSYEFEVGTFEYYIEASDGTNIGKCSTADSPIEVKVEHAYNSGEIKKEPTCTETGTRVYTCSACDDTYTEEIAATGHDYSTEWTIDKTATCSETGSKSHHCTKCDSKTDVTTIAKTEHTYDNGKVTTKPDCTTAGVKTYTCNDCGDTYTEEISAMGHNYSTEWTIDKAATCMETGSKSHHCTQCGSKANVTVIPASEHLFGKMDNGYCCKLYF